MRLQLPTHNMLLAFLFLRLSLHAVASPLLRHEVEEVGGPLRRRQDPSVAITGINAYGVQPRLEIRQLEQNVDQWNIFLLGLVRFQQTDQSNMTSYYQIAGIHGRPYIPWDNVPSAEGIDSPGYCMHVLNLFLAWHRPYLALYEQTLYTHIIAAVNSFPAGAQRQRYAAAALAWRFPYWDWAAAPPDGESVFPASVQSPTVNVTTPNGTASIPNPLFSYQFHPVSASDFYFNPFATWNETKRYPTSWSEDAVSQNAAVAAVLDNNRVSFQDRLYNLFVNYNNFTEFGNEAWMDSGVQNADSLESLHDVIHSLVGSSGHMTYLDYSAFDPTFWLHHGMIDRSFALWQALNPDSYVEPMAAVEQTFTITVGDMQDENSPLEPFFSDIQPDYWTSASVRSTQSFGYTYPELIGNANISAVKAAINQLYGSSAGSSGLSKRAANGHPTHERDVPNALSNLQFNAVKGEVDDGKYWQYLANIVSEKFALNGSYAIYLFLGDFDDTPSAWSTDPNLIGTHAVFAALTGVDAASNPQIKFRRSSSAVQVTGIMLLTSMLVAKVQTGELASMDPDTVAPYLQANMQYRVGTFDGTLVPVEDLGDLVVTIVSAEVQPASSIDQFPTWSSFTELHQATNRRTEDF